MLYLELGSKIGE